MERHLLADWAADIALWGDWPSPPPAAPPMPPLLLPDPADLLPADVLSASASAGLLHLGDSPRGAGGRGTLVAGE